MQFRELGRTHVLLPEVGLGMWGYRGGADVLRKGIEAGAAFIDTAEIYGTEGIAGEALKGIRDRVFVATKTHHYRRREIFQCAEDSLRRLGVETIDLYQLHWPNASVPIEETMGAMEDLVDQGKVRFIGVSNFTLPELKKAQACLRKHKIVSNQLKYSLIDRTIERELLPYCRENGLTVIAYSPLANKFLKLLEADQSGVLSEIANETKKTKAQVALNWCLLKPGVVVIPKTESLEHVVENCEASGWSLTGEQAARLDRSVRFTCRSPMVIRLRTYVRRARQRVRGR